MGPLTRGRTWTPKRGKTNKGGTPPHARAGVAERPKAADSRSALVGVPRFESWPRHKNLPSRTALPINASLHRNHEDSFPG